MIFQYLQAKWQQFLGYTVGCCCALGRQLRKFLTVAQIEKTSFLLLQLYAKAAKQRLLNLTNHSKPFYNMITKTDDDDLKISEQMRLKMGYKLKAASLNSKFTDSYKKKYSFLFPNSSTWKQQDIVGRLRSD